MIRQPSQESEDYNQKLRELSIGIYQGSNQYQASNQQSNQQTQITQNQSETDERSFSNSSPRKDRQQKFKQEEELVLFDNNQNSSKGGSQHVKICSKIEMSNENILINSIKKEQQSKNIEYGEQMQFLFPSMMSVREQSLIQDEPERHMEPIQERNDFEQQTSKIKIPTLQCTSQKINAISFEKAAQNNPILIQEKSMNPKQSSISLPKIQIIKFIGREDQQMKARIVGYEKQYFLKMETQIFQIQLKKNGKISTIRRRFADFALLQKLICYRFAGHILYPFPLNNMQFFKKLNLSKGTQKQKIILRQKRLFQLQNYLNFLLSHQKIQSSNIIQAFSLESRAQFEKQMKFLQQTIIIEQKQLEYGAFQKNFTNIKKMVQSKFNFFGYLPSPKENPEAQKKVTQLKQIVNQKSKIFATAASNKLQLYKQKNNRLLLKFERLAAIYKQNSQTSNIESNIDNVLKLSSKVASSRALYQKHSEWINDKIIFPIKSEMKWVERVQAVVNYRLDLVNRFNRVSTNNVELASNIARRIDLFDSNFLLDWRQFYQQIQYSLQNITKISHQEWKNHSKAMAKLWQRLQ